MIFRKSTLRAMALAAGTMVAVSTGSYAQNANYAPGDLVLFFQQEGSQQTVYASLGSSSSIFRDAVADLIDIVNLNTELTTAFGATWATSTDLYMGVAGVWGTSATNTSLQNGDPHRTLYVGQSRSSVGTAGLANSAGYSLTTDTGMSNAASGIQAMALPFEQNYSTKVAVSPTSTSTIDEQNPFFSAGIQGTAFGVFGGGVQQKGTAGIWSSTLGPETNVEFALDLYRLQAVNNIVGQFGFGDAIRQGDFQGTVTLDTTGNVSFIAPIPEPSTIGLMAIGAVAAAFCARRRRA